MWGERMTPRERKELEDEEKNTCSMFINGGIGGIDYAERGFSRARRRVFDLLCSNIDLNMFVTVTVDFGAVGYAETVRRLGVWLDNQVRRKGLKYILVPEYDDDMRRIHFHGVVNEGSLTLVNSGYRRGRKVIYNVTSWKQGFTTAVRIGKRDQDWQYVARHVVDYMLKAEYGKIGGRYYLHGGKLAEPIYRYAYADYSTADGNEITLNGALRLKIHRFL